MASSLPSLAERLKGELTCSMCLNLYTDPKTLPCLHAFCCQCLNQLAENSSDSKAIACPECRTEINLPQGSNVDAFPSSFYLNRLRDLVSDQDQAHQVLCGSCDEKSTAIAYCFSCEYFICIECQDAHLRLKSTKGHRMTALNELQETDVQEILRRPQFCQEASHTKEVLKYFCKPCELCICQKCAMMAHKTHEFVPMEEAAGQARLRMEESIEKVQTRADVCREQMRQSQKNHRETEEQILTAQQAVQQNTKRLIEMARQHEKDMLAKLGAIEEDERRKYEDKKEILEVHIDQLNSVADQLEQLQLYEDFWP